MPDQERWGAWQRVFRDFAIVVVGVFMLVHETTSGSPSPVVIAAGLTALGLPPVIRLDEARRRKDG